MTHQQLVPCTVMKSCKIGKPFFGKASTPDKSFIIRMWRLYDILGSCNGLLCVRNISQGYVRLFNPSTRLRSKRSPTAVLQVDGIVRYHGFGYDQVNDKYKVLVLADNLGKTVTKLYTFGTNSWTTIQNSPFILPTSTTRWLGKFVSGTLNWATKGGVSSDQWVILSFDLVKESYGQVLLPPQQDSDNNICNHVLDVLSNCLCVCFKSNETHWVVWLMKEYGVVESWTKLMMIPSEKFRYGRWLPSFDHFCIWVSGGVLVKNLHSKLVLYDSKDGGFEYPRLWRELLYDLHIYHESLVSPLW